MTHFNQKLLGTLNRNPTQELSAPISVLDSYPNATDILSSEGLIISSRGQINFFHESFFDHVYSRAFLKNEHSLIELLTKTEQHLFRRTQVRQILETLRQHDINRYLIELSSSLYSKKIRFHIKVAICHWLSSIEQPTDKEFEIISHFDQKDGKWDRFINNIRKIIFQSCYSLVKSTNLKVNKLLVEKKSEDFSRLFRSAVLSTHSWFDLLYKTSWIQKQLDSENKYRVDSVLWWLGNITDTRSEEVSGLLRTWWVRKPECSERLLNWFCYIKKGKADDSLINLCDDIINSNHIEIFNDQGHHRIDMLLRTLIVKTPEYGWKVLHSLLESWFKNNPGQNLFGRHEIKYFNLHSFSEIAKKSPICFLKATTDALVRSIDIINAKFKAENRFDFMYRTYSGHRFGFDEFLEIYRSSLKTVAQENPEKATFYLDNLDPYKHECFMHLHLEVIQANPLFFAKRLPSFTNNKLVFDAGWNGANWLSFAHACREAFPSLTNEERVKIENAILKYIPEIDRARRIISQNKKDVERDPLYIRKEVIRYLYWSKYEQWCILETIGEGLLSPKVKSNLNELRRKFHKEKIEIPNNVAMRPVNPPINRKNCRSMNDSHWLSAIERYNNEREREYDNDFIFGGAAQLATELQEATKKEPERFSDLSLEIPATAHSTYVEHILWGLAEVEASSKSLIQAIKGAHQRINKPYGSAIIRMLDRHPSLAKDIEILEILLWYALYGEADINEDSNERIKEDDPISINSLVSKCERLYFQGLSTVRGSAWHALGSVLWQVPEGEILAWEKIDIALDEEELISVRCCIIDALTPLFNMNKDHFAESIKKLIYYTNDTYRQNDAELFSPLVTRTGVKLFPYIYHWLPKLAEELTSALIKSGDKNKELIGAWLIFCESFRNNGYRKKVNKLSSLSVDHRRLLSSVVSDAINWAENIHQVKSFLKKFFIDKDKQVRTNAANVFRNVKVDDVELYHEVTKVFLKSQAFLDDGFPVLNMLENATCDVLDHVIEAAQHIILDLAEDNDQQKQHNTDLHQIQKLLKREYASSESNNEAREKILDLIDIMLSYEIYGVDTIVTAHDRW